MFKDRRREAPENRLYNLYEPVVHVLCPEKVDMVPRLRKVIGATWAEDIAEAMQIGNEERLFKGTALWQGLEYLQFYVTIERVTRVFTHQLVRMRIGTTYSQQCSGDMDWRHQPLLIPPSATRNGETLAAWVAHSLSSMRRYAQLVDNGMSVQEARFILPQNVGTFIIMNSNLAALAPWVRKRTCVQTQAWEMIVVANEVKRQILEAWPELAPVFADDCAAGRCFWAHSIRAGDLDAHTNLYRADHRHPSDLLGTPAVYEATHEQMVGGPGIVPGRLAYELEVRHGA